MDNNNSNNKEEGENKNTGVSRRRLIEHMDEIIRSDRKFWDDQIREQIKRQEEWEKLHPPQKASWFGRTLNNLVYKCNPGSFWDNEEKQEIVNKILDGEITVEEFAKQLHISKWILNRWIKKYRTNSQSSYHKK